jgi:hypothetical protein
VLAFWRIFVVAVNSVLATKHDRWIDGSFWLAEDPLYQIEIAITRTLIPDVATPHVKLYAVEVVGTATWAIVAMLIYLLVRDTNIVAPLNEIRVSWKELFVLAATALAGAYAGSVFRERLVALLHFGMPWSIEAAAMILAVVIAGTVPPLLVACFFYGRERRRSPVRLTSGE